MTTTIMPIQPIKDNRFIPNRIVQYLLDNGGIDLNQLAYRDFTDQERMQFAQLIGYSLGGFSDLSYVDDETYGAAQLTGIPDLHARNQVLREKIKEIKKGLKIAASAAFEMSPDDFNTN